MKELEPGLKMFVPLTGALLNLMPYKVGGPTDPPAFHGGTHNPPVMVTFDTEFRLYPVAGIMTCWVVPLETLAATVPTPIEVEETALYMTPEVNGPNPVYVPAPSKTVSPDAWFPIALPAQALPHDDPSFAPAPEEVA
jgi:hypothetical protein